MTVQLFLALILASGISITIFTVLLLISKEKRSVADWLLIGWLSSLSANQLFFLYSSFDNIWTSFLIDLVLMGMVLVHAPLLYLFFKYLFSESIPSYEIFHAIPFCLFLIIFGLINQLSPESIGVEQGFMVFTSDIPLILRQYGLFFATVAGSYTLLAFLQIKKKIKLIDQFHSNDTRSMIRWFQTWIFTAVVFFVITAITIEVSVSTGSIDSSFTFSIVGSILTSYIFIVCFFGLRYTRIFQETIPSEILKVQKSQHIHLDEFKELAELLIRVVKDQKLYLDPNLTLSDLALAVDKPSVQVSIALNRVLSKNFYQFINEYRAECFISRLDNPFYQHLSILGLANECGFGSKSTFNEFFKSYTGTTPSGYKKRMKRSV